MNFLKYENFIPAEKIIGYEFKNKALLVQAFTRRSYSEENFGAEHNEVLEFIGDSLLGALVVKRLSSRYRVTSTQSEPHASDFDDILVEHGMDPILAHGAYRSELDEDELSRFKIALVRSESLAAATERAGLEKFLLMSRGDEKSGVREERSVKEDLFEAIVGAVAIDSGWDNSVVEALIDRLLDPDAALEAGLSDEDDCVTQLEAYFAERGGEPIYKTERSFCEELPICVCIELGDDMLGYTPDGYGKTVEGAKRMAAKRAMQYIRKMGERASGVIAAVGEPDNKRAVNQLQELWQKGIISKPEYIFEEVGRGDSGNPTWTCTCVIAGVSSCDEDGWVCESKAEAKREAAFDTLLRLVGKKY